MSDFFNTSTPRGRKDYRCEWCGESIPTGEKHVHCVGMWEGDWQNWRMHNECYESASLSGDMQEGFSPYEHERPKTELHA